ncbi:MAG TPA: chloride channel protein [Actinomycetota bacterium]|nr:chloride channel protein [Actinomycetota bacterium]
MSNSPAGRMLRRLQQAGYLRKWLVLGALIGIIAGLGAILFVTALEWASRFFLSYLAGYTPPSPFGEGHAIGSGGFARPWALPLVVGLGGLISGVLVFRFAPEAEGHGTDAAITAVHRNPQGIRARVSLIKIIASAVTIGSGGSAGREGPTAQISAGFGSLLARRFDLTPADARIAVAVGIGSGIGAIFRAPLGGAVLGAEILYRDDIEVEALIPSIVASIVGFSIFGAVEGFTPIFGFLHGYRFTHPLELVYYAGIGLAAGVVGILYAKSFYGLIRVAHRLPGSPLFKPAIAGVLVGLLGLVVPGVIGTGYGWVQRAMGPGLFTISLWMVLALPFAKILATSLSIGSGGSGGIFGPGMVIGGFVGAAAWRLLSPIAPSVPHTPAPFVIVGMIACFGSIAHAPLAVMLMVAEMTGSLDLLAPAMVAVGLATLVVGDHTIYQGQLKTRADLPAHRFRFGLPLLASVSVKDVMSKPRVLIPADGSASESLQRLREERLVGAPVVDADGVFMGSIEAEALSGNDEDVSAADLAEAASPTIPVDATLDAAVEALAANQVNWVPILDAERRVVGIIAAADLIRGQRLALQAALRRVASAPRGTALVEERLGRTSPLAELRISEVDWPAGTVVVSIQRRDQLLFPEPQTVLEPDDVVSLLTHLDAEDSLRLRLRGELGPGPEPEAQAPDLI